MTDFYLQKILWRAIDLLEALLAGVRHCLHLEKRKEGGCCCCCGEERLNPDDTEERFLSRIDLEYLNSNGRSRGGAKMKQKYMKRWGDLTTDAILRVSIFTLIYLLTCN